MTRTFFKALAAVAAMLLMQANAGAAAQESFPSRPVTIVVGFSPGGGGDTAMRWVARYLTERWGVPVVVENKPGAGATLASGQVARAKPDGYTVMLATSSPLTTTPYFQKVPYDPAKDFTYLFQFLVSAQPLFVRSDSPFKTMDDLLSWARQHPGELFWSTAATNGATHIATLAAFKSAGVEATYVPFKGGTEPMNALLAGQIQAVVSDGFLSFLQAGQVRLLAETGATRVPDYPEIPTYKELGFPLSVPIFYGLAGPAGIPDHVVREWAEAGVDIMKAPGFDDMVRVLRGTPAYLDEKDFTSRVTDMYGEMGRYIADLGLKTD